MTIVRTKTPSGEAIVILPEAEFERLMDLAQDGANARTVSASQDRLASGTDEHLTLDDLDRLRAAKTPLLFWRERRGLSAGELTRMTGIDVSLVVALERDERIGDAALYRALATALAVDTDDLTPTAAAE